MKFYLIKIKNFCYQKINRPINEFDKIAGYKINIQKYVVSLYTKLSERKNIQKVPFTIASKNNKIHGNKTNEGSKRPVLGKL